MHGVGSGMGTPKAGTDLHEAARIAGRHPIGAGGRNVAELRREYRVGRRWLEEIVDPGGAAALFGVRERNER